jgi:hypothetical protein
LLLQLGDRSSIQITAVDRMPQRDEPMRERSP